MYYNCRKNKYFILFYLKLKKINNIKKIEEEKNLINQEKKNPKGKLLFRVSY